MIDKLVLHIDRFLSNNLKKVKNLNRFIAFICLIFLIQVMSQENVNFSWNFMYLYSILLIFIGYLFQSLSWSYIISEKLQIKDLVSWFTSLIGKYLPLKIGIPILRITDDLYVDNPDSKKYLYGVLIEVFLQIASGCLLISVYVLSSFVSESYSFGFLVYFIILICNYLINRNKYILILITNSISYLFFTLSITFTGIILYQETIIELGLAYVFSSVVSLIFVGSPAGIGVREYIFILLFQNNVFFEIVNFVEFLIVVRLLFIFSDMFSFLIGKVIKALNT